MYSSKQLKIPYKLRDYKIKISSLNFLKHIKFDKKLKIIKKVYLLKILPNQLHTYKDEKMLNNFLKTFLVNKDLPLHIRLVQSLA